jgi:hypothetical protein
MRFRVLFALLFSAVACPFFTETRRDMLQHVLVNQMQLTMSDAATLLGAHTLGHVHVQISGFGLVGASATNDSNPC